MKIPEYLLADNSQDNPDRIYVVHTIEPRFIVGSYIEDFNTDQKILWISEKPESENEIADLLVAAEEFINNELDNQEDLFDEE